MLVDTAALTVTIQPAAALCAGVCPGGFNCSVGKEGRPHVHPRLPGAALPLIANRAAPPTTAASGARSFALSRSARPR